MSDLRSNMVTDLLPVAPRGFLSPFLLTDAFNCSFLLNLLTYHLPPISTSPVTTSRCCAAMKVWASIQLGEREREIQRGRVSGWLKRCRLSERAYLISSAASLAAASPSKLSCFLELSKTFPPTYVWSKRQKENNSVLYIGHCEVQ